MKFSMNGFRRNLSQQISELKEEIERVLADDHIDKEDLANAMNEIICASNCLNCVWIEGNKDFVKMDDLEIPIIETEDYE